MSAAVALTLWPALSQCTQPSVARISPRVVQSAHVSDSEDEDDFYVSEHVPAPRQQDQHQKETQSNAIHPLPEQPTALPHNVPQSRPQVSPHAPPETSATQTRTPVTSGNAFVCWVTVCT